MAKIKVSELAAQLDKSSSEIVSILQARGVAAADDTVLEDNHVAMVKRALAQKKDGEGVKKRASVVFRPQNSSLNRGGRSGRGGQQSGQRRPAGQGQGQRRPAGQGQQGSQQTGQGQQSGQRRPAGQSQSSRPAGQRTGRPSARPHQNGEQRTAQPAGENEKTVLSAAQVSSAEEKTASRNSEGRHGDERPRNDRRQQGDRQQSERSQGERRQQGERRSQGGYNRSQGDRPQGERRQQTDRRGSGSAMPKPDSYVKPGQAQNSKANKKQDSKSKNKYEKREKEDFFTKMEKNVSKKAQKPAQPAKPVPAEDEIKTLVLPESLTIKELADKMKIQPAAIVKKLFMQGKVVTINQEVDYETAESIALEFDFLCEQEEKVDVIAELLKDTEDKEEDMVSRPPVVCVMGHVDHGKTSLLDAIRETNVIAREAGGITQRIGAYVVEINGQKITFLDTPGHEAFTAMRMRGAQSTDIAILVVAADDGVMPQTIEAINHAKAAGVEIIVAINKIDKPSANVERVKQELTEYDLIPEDWGGSTIFVPVSAHTKEGIETLLEMILLVAEVKELKANPNRNARGLVIEAELDKGKGPVATVLVQKGTLHVGDAIAAGSCYGKVRAMIDDRGRRVKEAGPSTPVEILGLNDVPNAGEVFVSPDTEKEARNFADTFIKEGREKLLEDTKSKLSLDDLFSQIKAGNVKELEIIIKADVQGSVEAVKQSLEKLSNEEVVVKTIHGGVGAITESDVMLASASNAIIIGFNVRPDATARSVAEREKVDIRLYKVIYQAIADVEAAMKGMLDPIYEEQVLGHGVVRQTFKASGVGTIAGVYVMDGKFVRNCSCRITRDGEQLFDGALVSLKRFKDDVKEVAAGYECGLVFDKFNDLKEDDMVEAYTMVEVPR